MTTSRASIARALAFARLHGTLRALAACAGLALPLAAEPRPTGQAEPGENAATQETPSPARTPSDALDKQSAYLERNPFHGRVFEDLVAAAELAQLEGGGLAGLARMYEARVAADPAGLASRVLLARVSARRGDSARAREWLTGLLTELLAREDDEARTQRLPLERLLAHLELEAGDLDAARERLTRLAAALAARGHDGAAGGAALLERDAHEALLEELAEAHDVAGDFEGVRSALAQLEALVGGDVAGRVAVAARCEEHGFIEDAERALRAAIDATADDPARRCTALAALGKLLERARRGDEALATYDEALALLGAGHWLREDLLARSIELRIRGGSLAQWLEERRAASARDPLTATLDIVRAYERTGRGGEAAELLASLATARPDDRELGARLVVTARAAGRFDLALDLLQRRAASAKSGAEVARAQLELSEALAETGAEAGAQLALERAAGAVRSSDDLGVLLTVAHRRAAFGDISGARATLEAAAALAPTACAPLLELAQLEGQHEALEARDAALVRAAERADGSERLTVAEAWLELGRVGEAEALLERAQGDPQARAAALQRLAESLLESRADAAPDAALSTADAAARTARVARARGLLRTLATESHGPARSAALEALTRSFDGDAARRGAVLAEQDTAQADPQDVVPALLSARLYTLLDEHALAAAEYERAIALEPGDIESRTARVRALARAQDFAPALEELALLASLDPERRTVHMLERARLLTDARRVDEARGVLAEVAARARRSPDLLRQVAARYQALDDPRLAAGVMERIVRLDPDDTRTARSLARLQIQLGLRKEGCERLASSWAATDDAGERKGIVRELEQALGAGPERDAFLNGLVMRAREDRFDRTALDLALVLLPRFRRFGEVGALGALLLARAPDDPRGLAARSIASAAAGDVNAVASDVAARVARGEAIDEVLESLLDGLRASDDEALADALGGLAVDAGALARTLRVPGYDRLTGFFLRGHARARGLSDGPVLDVLAELRLALEPPEFTLQVLHALEARDGATVVTTHAIGRLHFVLGDREACLARGRKLVELGASKVMVASFFTHCGLAAEHAALFPPSKAGEAGAGDGQE